MNSTFLIKMVGLMIMLGLSTSSIGKPKSVKVPKKLPKSKSSVILTSIEAESDKKLSVVNIKFNKKPSWEKVEKFQDHGTFLQVNLEGVMVPEPGKFFEGNSQFIKKIAAFQVSSKTAGIRFFLSQPAKLVKQVLKAELLGKRIVVTLDHKKMKQLLKQEDKVAAAVAMGTPKSGKSIEAETAISNPKPGPADETASTIGGKTPNLRQQLINAAIFCGALLLMLVGVLVMKPYLRRRKNGDQQKIISMKTLATLPLATKQKLSLIEVAGEKILLGVTPENISFITTIDSVDKVSMSQVSATNASNFSGLLEEEQAPAPKKAPKKKSKISFQSPKILDPSPVARKFPRRAAASAETPTEQPVKPVRPKRKPQERIGAAAGKINIGIDDDGVKNFKAETTRTNRESAKTNIKKGDENSQAIEDVTRLIRDKLKTLKSL